MASRNTYTAATQELAELYADYVEGDASRAALVVSERVLGDAARNALEKSMESFGYKVPTCTFVVLEHAEHAGAALDANALFVLMEGLDPRFVFCTDAESTRRTATAYREQFSPDSPIRVFGRPGVAFEDLTAMMMTERGKQSAWRLLKTLVA